jgi:hypothetical protein
MCAALASPAIHTQQALQSVGQLRRWQLGPCGTAVGAVVPGHLDPSTAHDTGLWSQRLAATGVGTVWSSAGGHTLKDGNLCCAILLP